MTALTHLALHYIWLIMALPLAASLFITLLIGILPARPSRLSAGIAISAMGTTFVLALLVFFAFADADGTVAGLKGAGYR